MMVLSSRRNLRLKDGWSGRQSDKRRSCQRQTAANGRCSFCSRCHRKVRIVSGIVMVDGRTKIPISPNDYQVGTEVIAAAA
jgi:hypothetical protein